MSLKLLMAYNIKSHKAEDYYRFIMSEFLPRAQTLGLVMTEGWQTIYGDYPARLLAFAAQEDAVLLKALQSDDWDSIETKLGEFITDYQKRVVKAKPNFQFFLS